MNDNLEVWWNGRPGHYLCVTEPEIRDLSAIPPLVLRHGMSLKQFRPYRDRGAMRSLILSTLKARGQMTIKALRAIVEPNDAQFYNLVTRMTEQGLVIRGQRGLVALKRGSKG